GFDPDRVAAYGEKEIRRLLGDAGIIRNRRKIEAVIENAKQLRVIRDRHGGFANWLDEQHPLPLADWVKRMRATFVFMGPEVVNEFLMSTGYLPGAHDPDCPVGQEVARLSPAWMRDAPPGAW
ncbi:MAG TPA: DNA-3-methyladenine glycosylase I, partial [Alphaproteobacteria bacterium]|nr:DNA-3-methyladenine glycosylase I [Alphaproteobacteria bacterium]